MAVSLIRGKCPACHRDVRFSADLVGQPIKCESCGATFRPRIKSKPTPAQETKSDSPENTFEFGPPAVKPPKKRSKLVALAVAGVVLLGGAVGAAALMNRHEPAIVASIEQKPQEPPPPTPTPKPKSLPEKKGKGKKATAEPEQFPRRMLVISVNNYLYANPILFGAQKRSPAALLERLGEAWRIPRDQLYFLSDAKTNRGSTPPIKPVIQKAIESFLETTRSQDRIVILFAGHAAVVDGKPFLVPLEGELTVAESLIPFAWLAEKLRGCKAAQKLLILDIFRNDPGRGSIRPSPGPMDPDFESALNELGKDMQIWTSCAAKQFSFEYAYQTFGGRDTEGSVFLNSFFHAFLQGATGKARPQDPLAVNDLAAKVAKYTAETVKGIENTEQTPRLFGSAPAGESGYDPATAPARRAVIPKPADITKGGLADPQLVRSIFKEIQCPPIKSTSGETLSDDGQYEFAFRFSAATMAAYAADNTSVQDIVENASKYPVRAAVLKAVEILERHGRGEVMIGSSLKKVGLLREEYAGPSNEAAKKTILKEQHDGPAAMYLELEDSLRELEKLKEIKDQEQSKRWLAHYDYVLALTKARFAYINEYNFALGKIRKDELPPIDSKIHKGWRLAAVEKMSSPREIKDQADDARRLFEKLIKEHPGTPWEVLAKRDRLTALGLVWQPAGIKAK